MGIELKLILGVVSSVLALICFLPYIRDVLKRKTEPHMYSWLVWTVLQTIGVSAQFSEGAGYGAWALAIGVFFCFVIFILSFKFGTKNISRFDTVCLVASLVAIVVFLGLENAVWAVILVSVIDFFGFLPTFRKGYQEPHTETVSTFIMSAICNALSLLALQNYTAPTIIYVASLLFTNSSFSLMIVLRRRWLSAK